MANEHEGYTAEWTLVAATPEQLNLGDKFKAYRLTDLNCRVLRPVDMCGHEYKGDRLNLLLDNTPRGTDAKIAGAKIG